MRRTAPDLPGGLTWPTQEPRTLGPCSIGIDEPILDDAFTGPSPVDRGPKDLPEEIAAKKCARHQPDKVLPRMNQNSQTNRFAARHIEGVRTTHELGDFQLPALLSPNQRLVSSNWPALQPKVTLSRFSPTYSGRAWSQQRA